MDREIKYHLINSAIAGGLVTLGSLTPILTTGEPNFKSLGLGLAIGVVMGAIVFLNKFKDYWDKELPEYTTSTMNNKIFNFL